MPIDKSQIVWDEAPKQPTNKPIEYSNIQWDYKPMKYTDEMIGTLKNIGKVYPAFETAANIATSSYGIPISGLVGLAALPFGLDAANSAVEAVQKFLVYDPKTPAGQETLKAATYPLQQLEKVAEKAGGKAAEKIGPKAGATVHTMVSGMPVLLGLKSITKAGATPKQIKATVEKGINKGIRPSIVKKEMWHQRNKYMQNAEIAVKEIIENKENLQLIDREGNKVSGLPKTLEQFSQAIEQTKKDVYTKYDTLAKLADDKGAAIPMQPVIKELTSVLSDPVMQSISPDTIKYAKNRIEGFVDKIQQPDGSVIPQPKTFTATQAQQMVQILNQSEKAFYANPTPEMKGRAYIDAMVANNLRAGLDAAIEKATGIEYAPIKRQYGALRMLETDVTKRAIVDARKNIKGLIDFSDVFSSSQLIYGLFSGQPASIAAGATSKGMASYLKYINDPNRTVKNMFRKVESLPKRRAKRVRKSIVRTTAGSMMVNIDDYKDLED